MLPAVARTALVPTIRFGVLLHKLFADRHPQCDLRNSGKQKPNFHQQFAVRPIAPRTPAVPDPDLQTFLGIDYDPVGKTVGIGQYYERLALRRGRAGPSPNSQASWRARAGDTEPANACLGCFGKISSANLSAIMCRFVGIPYQLLQSPVGEATRCLQLQIYLYDNSDRCHPRLKGCSDPDARCERE
jgi:hypothetical protein